MAEFAFEPEPELKLAPGESFREISGRSPWAIAGRRLVRNRLAMAALALFLLIVLLSFLAPVYAHHIADTDPFVSNLSGTTEIDGKQVEVIQQGGGLGLGLGEMPTTALDARRSSALSRALGAPPQQVSAGLSAAHMLPALAGAVLGIRGRHRAVSPPLAIRTRSCPRSGNCSPWCSARSSWSRSSPPSQPASQPATSPPKSSRPSLLEAI